MATKKQQAMERLPTKKGRKPSGEGMMIRVSGRIPSSIHAALWEESRAKNYTESEMIREILIERYGK